MDRSQPHRITVRHHRERGAVPAVLHGRVLDQRPGFSRQLQFQRFVDPQPVDRIDEPRRLAAVGPVHRFSHPDIGRFLEHLLQSQPSETSGMGIHDFHRPDLHLPLLRIDRGGERHVRIVQQSDQTGQFERGTGFHTHPDRIVVILDQRAVRPPRDVRKRLDIARGHLHHDRTPPVGLGLDDPLLQSALHHVLHLDIKGGHHIVAVHRIYVLVAGYRRPETSRNLLLQRPPGLSAQVFVETALDPQLDPRLVHETDRAPGQRAVRMDTPVVFDGEKPAPVRPQTKQGKFSELLQLQEIDLAARNQMVAFLFGMRRDQLGFVFGGILIFEKMGQAQAQRIDVQGEQFRRQPSRGHVHAQLVIRNRGSEQPPVVGIDIAPRPVDDFRAVAVLVRKVAQGLPFGPGLQPDHASDHGQPQQQEQDVQYLDPPQDRLLDGASLRLAGHAGRRYGRRGRVHAENQSSMTWDGAPSCTSGMPRSRSNRSISLWRVRVIRTAEEVTASVLSCLSSSAMRSSSLCLC